MPKLSTLRGSMVGPLRTLDLIRDRSYTSPSTSNQLMSRYLDSRIDGAGLLKFRTDLVGHFGCVNAIEFSNNGGLWIASGGDDKRVLVWNTERALDGAGAPVEMTAEHNSNIFCLMFDNENQRIFSGGNDEQVILHDIQTKQALDVFLHKDAIYCLAVDPDNSKVFVSACDDGRVLVWDTRLPPAEDPLVLANYMAAMHAVMYNPVEPRLLATANASEGIALWDIRKPGTCLLRYGGSLISQSCMSVRFNSLGDQLLALRRRLPPVLYSIHSPSALCQFDSATYLNSCTMKSCCFSGNKDQFVISGSDDCNLYMWKIPPDLTEFVSVREAHTILSGHRSIVNQVRYNPDNSLIISSGVEKIIKAWSAVSVRSDDSARTEASSALGEVSGEELLDMMFSDGPHISHDYSQRSTAEDPRMIAFFDTLVRREREGEDVGGGLNSDLDIATGYEDDFVHTDLSLDSTDESSSSSSVMSWRRGAGLEEENESSTESSESSSSTKSNHSDSSDHNDNKNGEVETRINEKKIRNGRKSKSKNLLIERDVNTDSASTSNVEETHEVSVLSSSSSLDTNSERLNHGSSKTLLNGKSGTKSYNRKRRYQYDTSDSSSSSGDSNSESSTRSENGEELSESCNKNKNRFNRRNLKNISSYRNLRKRHLREKLRVTRLKNSVAESDETSRTEKHGVRDLNAGVTSGLQDESKQDISFIQELNNENSRDNHTECLNTDDNSFPQSFSEIVGSDKTCDNNGIQSEAAICKSTIGRLKRLRSQAMDNDLSELFVQKKTSLRCFEDNGHDSKVVCNKVKTFCDGDASVKDDKSVNILLCDKHVKDSNINDNRVCANGNANHRACDNGDANHQACDNGDTNHQACDNDDTNHQACDNGDTNHQACDNGDTNHRACDNDDTNHQDCDNNDSLGDTKKTNNL